MRRLFNMATQANNRLLRNSQSGGHRLKDEA